MVDAKKHLSGQLLDETFGDKDRSEIHGMIATLRRSYTDRLSETALEFHRAQRAVNRASHEITRLERHIERIDGFIARHNITMEEK